MHLVVLSLLLALVSAQPLLLPLPLPQRTEALPTGPSTSTSTSTSTIDPPKGKALDGTLAAILGTILAFVVVFSIPFAIYFYRNRRDRHPRVSDLEAGPGAPPARSRRSCLRRRDRDDVPRFQTFELSRVRRNPLRSS